MRNIVIAPFSNSHIRDWPPEHFAELIRLLIERWTGGGLVRVVGTATQRSRAYDIVRPFDAKEVSNDCGRLSWPAVLGEIRAAACVVGNNSGIAHLSASFGVPTVCIFGGSHQRLEWRPIGFSVAVVSRSIACSPCQMDHGQSCPYGKPCLTDIEPITVADAALRVMTKVDRLRDELEGADPVGNPLSDRGLGRTGQGLASLGI